MLNFLLILGAFAAIGAAIMKFLDEVGLRDPQKQSLQKRFDDWWHAVAHADSRILAIALAEKLSQAIDKYFGARLFSQRALKKSFLVSTCVLVLCLGLTGIQNGRTLGVAPWDAFQKTASQLKEIWSKELPPAKTEAEKQQQQEMKEFQNAVMQYNSTGRMIFYSVSSLLILVLLNAALFFLSVVYSRLILREIHSAGRVFATITLLIANFALVFPAWTVVFLLVTILFTPLLWLSIPLVFLLSRVSVYWLLAIVAGGSIAGWAFGSGPVKIITLIGFLPCLLTVVVTAFSGIVLINRDRFHGAASWSLRLCAEKGPVKTATATLALLAAILAAGILVIRYWK